MRYFEKLRRGIFYMVFAANQVIGKSVFGSGTTEVSRKYSLKTGRSIIFATLLLFVSTLVVFAIHNGSFELGPAQGAQIKAQNGGVDWASIFDGNGGIDLHGGVKAAFIPDNLAAKGKDDSTTFISSAKNNDPISSWQAGSGKVPAKSDLSNIYAYATLIDGDLVIYAGLERLDPDGDSHVDVELNQAKITVDNGSFTGQRTEDDILLVMDFTKGGDLGMVEIRRWTGSEWEKLHELNGEGCVPNDETDPENHVACAFNNGNDNGEDGKKGDGIEKGNWASFDRQGDTIKRLPKNAFTEMGINVTELLGNSACYATIQFKTRSSSSFTSELKDFALEEFSLCDARINIEPNQAANQVNTDHTFIITAEKKDLGGDWKNAENVTVEATLQNFDNATAKFKVNDVYVDDATTICTTDANGVCSVIINSATTGLSSVSVEGEVPLNGSTLTRSDGPAVKRWVDARLDIDQSPGTQIGDPHVISVTLEFDNGDGQFSPADGETVNFTITEADGMVINDSCVTGTAGLGTCAVSVNNASGVPGITTIVAEWNGVIVTVDGDAPAYASDEETMQWVNAQLILTPADAANLVNQGQTSHVMTATLVLDGGDAENTTDLAGQTINFTVDSGPGVLSANTCDTDSSGSCSITLQNDEQVLGVSNISASWSGNINLPDEEGGVIPVFATDTAIKRWIDVRLTLAPEVAANQVGIENAHPLTATLEYDDGTDGLGFRPADSATGLINFTLEGRGDLSSNSCDVAVEGPSCVVSLNSTETGTSTVTIEWSGTLGIGDSDPIAINSLTAGPVSKTWVDARLIVATETISGETSINNNHVISATLEFDYGDGNGFVPAPEGERIDFNKIANEDGIIGPGILNSNFCDTNTDGACTVILESEGLAGETIIEASWAGDIEVTAQGVTVSATANAETNITVSYYILRVSIGGDGIGIQCDQETNPDPPDSVDELLNINDFSGGGINSGDYELTPTESASNCLYHDQDIDFYWIEAIGQSSVVTVNLSTGGEANYDVAIFVDVDTLDESDPLQPVSLVDTTAVDSIGRMSSGRMSSGRMSSGRMSSGRMSSGRMSSGRMSSGRMSSGRMSSGSFQPSNADEQAVAHIEAGQRVFIAVLSNAGAYGPDYTVTAQRSVSDIGVCAWQPPFSSPISTPAFYKGKFPGNNPETLILTHQGRLEASTDPNSAINVSGLINSSNQNKGWLNKLADNSAVKGIIVPVDAVNPEFDISDITDAYTYWNDNYCNIKAANNVTDEVRALIEYYKAKYPSIKYVVIAGSHEIIPFRQIQEGPISISPESDYADASGTVSDTPLSWSLKNNRISTDDFYVDDDPIPFMGHQLFVADMPIGRMVETPSDMTETIKTFFAANNGNSAASTCLVTGYEFLTDSAEAIDQTFGTFNLSRDTLISDQWTAANLKNAWGDSPDLLSVNAHFEHWRALPAAGWKLFYSGDVPQNDGMAAYSVGCHGGLNVPDSWISDNHSDIDDGIRDDFPSVLARQGAAAWFANTGYGYGDDEAITDSELLMLYYSQELGNQGLYGGSSGAPVGQAMINAKDRFVSGAASGSLDIYQAKSLMEATLYGLPMYRVSVPAPQSISLLDEKVGPVNEISMLAYPDVDDSVFAIQGEPLALPNGLSVSTVDLNNITLTKHTIPGGSFYTPGGLDEVEVYAGRTIQPKISYELPGAANGALLLSAKYRDETDFDPWVSNPATDTTRLEATLSENGWFPATDALWAVNKLGKKPYLNVVAGQYNTRGRVQRVYESMQFETYSSNTVDNQPPGIWNPRTVCTGNDVTFSVKVEDKSGIQKVVVTYNDTGALMWKTEELNVTDHPDAAVDPTEAGSKLAEGTLSLGPNVEYFIQVVDGEGVVNIDNNYGLNYFTCVAPPTAVNNLVDDEQHQLTVSLEINNTGNPDAWEPYSGYATVLGLLSAQGTGTVSNSCEFPGAIDGICKITIFDAESDEFTTLTFSPVYTVEVRDDQLNTVDEFTGTLTGDIPSTYVKEWWAGSISIFKNVGSGSGEVCFTLSRPGLAFDAIELCQPAASKLLFTWDDLPTADNYILSETKTPSSLVSGGVVDDRISVDEANRHALIRTVNNNTGQGCTPGYWKNHLDKWIINPGTKFVDVFGVELPGYIGISMDGAINLGGGNYEKLARHGVAAWLSASFGPVDNSALNYTYSPGMVKGMVSGAIYTGSSEPAASILANANEAGCPLN